MVASISTFSKVIQWHPHLEAGITQGLRNPTAEWDELHVVLVKARVSPARAAGTGSLSVKSQLEALLTQSLGVWRKDNRQHW